MIDGQDGISACRSFHGTGGFHAIVKLISHSATRAAAIELLETLTICDPAEGLTAILAIGVEIFTGSKMFSRLIGNIFSVFFKEII